jgi:amidase
MNSTRSWFELMQQSTANVTKATVAATANITKHNPLVNALCTQRLPIDIDNNLRSLAQRIGNNEPVGMLAAMPYVAKDIHATKGLRTTRGSPIFADWVPTENDAIVECYLAADAILMGKSNTPEFAAGSQTFNTIFGATTNPYDATKTAGGSSGGAAAALATGMAVLACGSDLAASLRNPASFCGVVGFRPT